MSNVNIKTREYKKSDKYPKFWMNKITNKIICEYDERCFFYISGGTSNEKNDLNFGEKVLGDYINANNYIPFLGEITILVD